VNALPASLALLMLVAGTSVQAKDQKPSNSPAKTATADLKKGLDAMIASASPPGQVNRIDRDRGDDNASDRAIQVVCTKDTPAAQRSAICPRPISP
jgi:hypothetical protein